FDTHREEVEHHARCNADTTDIDTVKRYAFFGSQGGPTGAGEIVHESLDQLALARFGRADDEHPQRQRSDAGRTLRPRPLRDLTEPFEHLPNGRNLLLLRDRR